MGNPPFVDVFYGCIFEDIVLEPMDIICHAMARRHEAP